ncbi:N-acetylmuramoyl-L-alanine amidase [Streptomyces sp. NPDC001443]
MRRRGWGAAVLAVAAVTGTLVVQGIGDGEGGSGDKGKPGPIRTSTTTAALTVTGDGTSARLDRRDTASFSLLGVSWTDPAAHVTGTVEARARSTANGTWSKWRRLDGNSGDGAQDASRGGTAPMWFGPSDGVEVRMSGRASQRLPEGLRVAMVDPGSGTTTQVEPAGFVMDPVDPTDTADPVTPDPSAPDPADPSASESTDPPPAGTTSAAPTETATSAGSPDVSPTVSAPDPAAPSVSAASVPPAPASSAPRPPIASRLDWGADESISPEAPGYLPGGKIKAVVLHHTATSNDYTCAQAPAVIRSIYAYDVQELTWKDIGYNFLVDKCGTIYEGRKGGVDRPVMGAHAYGFNSETTGISIIGDYSTLAPSKEAMTAVARLAAWKLGQYGVDPTGTAKLTAGAAGPNYFRQTWAAGDTRTLPVIHGHRDGYNTVCPGDAYYNLLPTIRTWAGGPVEGLTLDSVTGDGMSGTTVLTSGAVTVKWSATTPAVLVRQYDVLVDGKVAATVAGSVGSARVDLTAGTHKVSVQGIHQSGWAALSSEVTVLAEPAPATTDAATTPAATPTTPAPTATPTTSAPTVTPTTQAPAATPTTKPTTAADKTPPAFSTKPNLALGLGTVNTTAVPLALKWKATDAGGLKEVRLTAPVAKTYGPTVLSANLTAKPGVTTTWRMTAYDRAGNTASASVSGTPVLLQETSATKSGTWTAKSSTSYLGGKSYGSSTKNASLSWTFTGRSAALVVSRAATSGQVYVYVDGVKTATVDLKSTTTKYRDAIWTKTWSASAKHTVKLVVVGTAGRPTVTADGLVYLK